MIHCVNFGENMSRMVWTVPSEQAERVPVFVRRQQRRACGLESFGRSGGSGFPLRRRRSRGMAAGLGLLFLRGERASSVMASPRAIWCMAASAPAGRTMVSVVVAEELHAGDFAVVAVLAHELVVGSDLGDAALLEDDDQVGLFHAADAVGDDEGGAAVHDEVHAAADQVFGFGIDAGGGVIEDEDARVGEDGPGDGQALLLPAGEGEPRSPSSVW